jgi:hypothetical protein
VHPVEHVTMLGTFYGCGTFRNGILAKVDYDLTSDEFLADEIHFSDKL